MKASALKDITLKPGDLLQLRLVEDGKLNFKVQKAKG
jgi:hypothetical protein